MKLKNHFRTKRKKLSDVTELFFTSPYGNGLQLVPACGQYCIGAALYQVMNCQPIPFKLFSKKFSKSQYKCIQQKIISSSSGYSFRKYLIRAEFLSIIMAGKPLELVFMSHFPAKADKQQGHLSCISEYIVSINDITLCVVGKLSHLTFFRQLL